MRISDCISDVCSSDLFLIFPGCAFVSCLNDREKNMRTVLIGLTIALAGCGGQSDHGGGKDKETATIAETPLGHFEDVKVATAAAPQDLSILQAQVMLDRAGFSPGQIGRAHV